MKIIKTLLIKSSKGIASLAFLAAIVSAGTNCLFVYHQPKAPIGLEKLKKLL